MKKIKYFSAIIIFLTLVSCGLKPISSEYTFIDTTIENVNLNDLGNGKILIHNGANVFHKIDATSSLNIWIDDKPLGQLKASEFVILNLKEGTSNFRVLHKDLVNMTSKHSVSITNETKVIMIKPTITSNKLEITNALPRNWQKFEYKAAN